MDENQEIIIRSVLRPQVSQTFTQVNLQSAFLQASLNADQIKDQKDKTILNNFFQGSEGPHASTTTSQVAGDRERPPTQQSSAPYTVDPVLQRAVDALPKRPEEDLAVLAGKKYKPVALKVRPVYGTVPEEFRIERHILGDPEKDMPQLPTHPPEFTPTGRYTAERREQSHKLHGDVLNREEYKVFDWLMCVHNKTFAWNDEQRGSFREDFFPPVSIPVVPHKPWVERNIPIPPGLYEEICAIILKKIKAGVYEPSNSSYRSKWFCVVKKDGKSLRLVHSLEPLNAVTIAHSGVPPATDDLANWFAGRACGGILDLYVGYDERLLAESSRDLTTFQTPFGVFRLRTLPMGWTNAVPIFHDDVTTILRPLIPDITIPYIDDVPVRGPETRYELPDGSYETIPENPGIRRFVWEHLLNVNRVLQHMGYSGGTFSGLKSLLIALQIIVVGHLCTYDGRRPEEDRVGVIERWGPCHDVSEVRQFLGLTGVFRMFIKDYAVKADPLVMLTRNGVPFAWELPQTYAQNELKTALLKSPPLKPVSYKTNWDTVLGVDTSYIAVGWFILQINPEDAKEFYYCRFGSLLLTEREARFSQPKRELFGVMKALHSAYHWLVGCRRLVVETDAKFLKGMLSNPGCGPNANINRWIKQGLFFHFTLRHVPGKSHAIADALSRRPWQQGDPVRDTANEEEVEPQGLAGFEVKDNLPDDTLPIDDFRDKIDTRGGYLHTELGDLDRDKVFARDRRITEAFTQFKSEWTSPKITQSSPGLFVFNQAEPSKRKGPFRLPDPILNLNDEETLANYQRLPRSEQNLELDDLLWDLRDYFNWNPVDITEDRWEQLCGLATEYRMTKTGRIYKILQGGRTALLIWPRDRWFIMSAARQARPNGGFEELFDLIFSRMWWPGLEGDVEQFLATENAQPTLSHSAATLPHILYLPNGPVSVTLPPGSNDQRILGADNLVQTLRQRHNLKPTDASAVAEMVISEMADGLRRRTSTPPVQALISSESIPRGLPHNLPTWAVDRSLPDGSAHGVGDFDVELERAKRETAEFNAARGRVLKEGGFD